MKNITTSLSFLGLLISTAIWGSTFFIVKDAIATIHPVTLVAYRFIIATGIFAVIALFKKEKIWNYSKHGFILGFFLWFQYISQTIGLKFTTASNSGFINGLFIIFVPILGFLFFKTKVNKLQIVSIIVALIGLYIVTGNLKSINYGDVITLSTAMSTGVYILVVDKFVKEKKSIVILNFQQFLTVAILSIITMFVFHLPIATGGTGTIFPILYLAIFGNAIGQGLMLLCQKNLKTITASLLLSTEPVFAAVFAWTLGNEVFFIQRAIGGLLILGSIFISDFSKKKRN